MRAKKLLALGISLAVAGGVFAFEQAGLGLPLERGVESVLRAWFNEGKWTALPALKIGYFTVAGLLAAWFCLDLPSSLRRTGYLMGLVCLTLTLTPVLGLRGVLFEPFTSVFVILFSGLTAMALAGSDREQRRQVLRRLFVDRLNEVEFKTVLRAGDGRQLTGRRQVSVVSCQVLNHAALAEQMEATELEDFLSSFVKGVAEFLVAKGGYLDSCEVQGVRVLFGFPNADENHAVAAARAALELRRQVVGLGMELETLLHKEAVMGIAISSGEVTTGMFGFREFEAFNAVGEVIDFANQLCQRNVNYGSSILVSAETLAAAREGLEVRPLEMIRRGSAGRMVEIYELLALKHGLTEEAAVARDAFWQGIILLRKGDSEAALKKFRKAEIEGVTDRPLAYFSKEAEAFGRGQSDQISTEVKAKS